MPALLPFVVFGERWKQLKPLLLSRFEVAQWLVAIAQCPEECRSAGLSGNSNAKP
jgi:hypothetical protein